MARSLNARPAAWSPARRCHGQWSALHRAGRSEGVLTPAVRRRRERGARARPGVRPPGNWATHGPPEGSLRQRTARPGL